MSKQISSNLVLSAIDIITRRKNRPNLERIIRYLYRVHRVSWETSFSLLKKLESEGKVVQVQYKGGYSYRNALSWRRYRTYRQNRLMESWTSISRSLSDILALEPTYFGSGVPAQVLEKCVLEKGVLNKNTFEELLQKEIEKQTLIRLENGNYFLGPQAEAAEGEEMPDFDPENDIEEVEESDGDDDAVSVGSTSTKTTDSPPKEKGKKRKLEETSIEEPPDPVEKDGPDKEEELEEQAELKAEETKEEEKNEVKEEEEDKEASDAPKQKTVGKRKKDLKNLPVKRSARPRFKYEPSDYYFPALKRKKRGDIPKVEKPPPPPPPPPPKKERVRQMRKRALIKQPTPKPTTTPPNGSQNSSKSNSAPASPPRRSSTQSQNESPLPEESEEFLICAICNFSGHKEKDKIFPCSSCPNKGHESCALKNGWSLGSQWNCPDCKEEINKSPDDENNLCVICELGCKKGRLITCDLCGEFYHLHCHNPKLKSAPPGKWRCSRCPEVSTLAQIQASILGLDNVDAKINIEATPDNTDKEKEKDKENLVEPEQKIKEEEDIKPEIPPQSIKEDPDEDPLSEYPIDPNIPDPSNWSSAQVYEYFKKHFKQDVAAAFQEQDIDGQSLLLMQRSDVINGLGFKLGTGLRVLYHVKQLQIRRSNYKLLWTV